MQDMAAWREMVREHAALEEIVTAYRAYEATLAALADCRSMLNEHLDAEMKELVHAELAEQERRAAEQEEALRAPSAAARSERRAGRDPGNPRPATGGDEASLFGADLLRMYLRYAERHGYRVEYLSSNLTDMGGVKEVVLSLGGRRGAYSRLKYESGVHRVQRVAKRKKKFSLYGSAAKNRMDTAMTRNR